MNSSRRGAALVVTLWLVAMGTVLALNYSLGARSQIQITAAALARQQARAAAEAAIWRAVYATATADPEAPWPIDGRTVEFEFNGADVRVITQDVSGLADLNYAPRETLMTIVSHVVHDPVRAQQIVARILDWRDPDHKLHPSGAEDPEYRSAGREYGAKDGPFNTREELQLVLGLSRDEYAVMEPYITVHAQKRAINLNAAPKHVIVAMGESRRPDSEVTEDPSQREAESAPVRLRRSAGLRRRSTLEIFVEAKVNGVVSRLAATVDLNHSRGNTPKLAILSWRETWPLEIPAENDDEHPPTG